MLTLLLPTLALALTHSSASMGTVQGWTADGSLVYGLDTHDTYAPADDDENGEPQTGTVHHVIVQHGDTIAHDWVVGSDLPSTATVTPTSQQAEWTAWHADNSLVAATRGRAGAAGVQFDVTSTAFLEWTGGTCAVTTGDSVDARITLSNAGKGSWAAHTVTILGPVMSSSSTTSIDAWWSPDGARVAVAVESPTMITMRGPAFGSVEIFVATAAPLISVLAPKSLGATVAGKVAAAIDGLGAIETGEAKAERDASVVYFATGHEGAARAIAARVPGGATVEPMTWDAAQHVVVAVGASAK